MTTVRFACGHGASPGDEGVVTLRRACPVCMLVHETHRSRSELLGRVAAPWRSALAAETRIGARYTWTCSRGHDRYEATVAEVLTGPGCQKCMRNAEAATVARDGGVASMNAGLRTRTSQVEQRLRALLQQRIRVPQGVNTVRVNRMFYGQQEVWPDIVLPALRIAVEYDDPGRSRRAHRGLKQASDREKDDALAEVGWEVIRVRAGGLDSLGANSIVCSSLTSEVADRIVQRMRELRGDAAVDAQTPASA
jgi:very-short-patch-repair endonuclease